MGVKDFEQAEEMMNSIKSYLKLISRRSANYNKLVHALKEVENLIRFFNENKDEYTDIMRGASFVTDQEKNERFFSLSKNEFLIAYDYLSEQDYEVTLNDVRKGLHLYDEFKNRIILEKIISVFNEYRMVLPNEEMNDKVIGIVRLGDTNLKSILTVQEMKDFLQCNADIDINVEYIEYFDSYASALSDWISSIKEDIIEFGIKDFYLTIDELRYCGLERIVFEELMHSALEQYNKRDKYQKNLFLKDNNLYILHECDSQASIEDNVIKWHNFTLEEVGNKNNYYVVQICENVGDVPRFSIECFEDGIGEWVDLSDIFNETDIHIIEQALIELSDEQIKDCGTEKHIELLNSNKAICLNEEQLLDTDKDTLELFERFYIQLLQMEKRIKDFNILFPNANLETKNLFINALDHDAENGVGSGNETRVCIEDIDYYFNLDNNTLDDFSYMLWDKNKQYFINDKIQDKILDLCIKNLEDDWVRLIGKDNYNMLKTQYGELGTYQSKYSKTFSDGIVVDDEVFALEISLLFADSTRKELNINVRSLKNDSNKYELKYVEDRFKQSYLIKDENGLHNMTNELSPKLYNKINKYVYLFKTVEGLEIMRNYKDVLLDENKPFEADFLVKSLIDQIDVDDILNEQVHEELLSCSENFYLVHNLNEFIKVYQLIEEEIENALEQYQESISF